MLENDKSAGQRIWPVYSSLREDDAQDGTKEMPQAPLSQAMLALLVTTPANLLLL